MCSSDLVICGNRVRVWDLSGGKRTKLLAGHTGQVWAAVCTEIDGRLQCVTASDDGTVRVWDLADEVGQSATSGPIGGIRSLACTEIGGRPHVLIAYTFGVLRMRNLMDGTVLDGVEYRIPSERYDTALTVACAVADGRPYAVTCGSMSAHVWDLTDGSECAIFGLSPG